MALKNNFYSEIFEKEQKWIELINSKLMNSIYCKFSLQPFYLEKKRELENEYNLTHNEIIREFINIIDSIITQIELLNLQYKNNKFVDINSLLPLFLTTQMSNNSKKEEPEVTFNPEISKLQIKKQILENQIKNYNREELDDQLDYLYDELPEQSKKVI